MNRIICFFREHQWDKRHGYNNNADFGAVCQRCGLKNETYKMWKERCGR